MFNFDNFDIDQMPSKFAQRQYYICNFCCKKIYDVGNLDNAENSKRNFFLTTLYQVQVSQNLPSISKHLGPFTADAEWRGKTAIAATKIK